MKLKCLFFTSIQNNLRVDLLLNSIFIIEEMFHIHIWIFPFQIFSTELEKMYLDVYPHFL